MSDVPEHPLVEPLSERELDVLVLLAEGKTNQEIALELSLSINTIKWYARQIYGKLGVDNREEAARRALALGLLPEHRADALPEHNLPAQLTPFVGRREELAAIEELLEDPATRLITVVGPGGIGKTRLAIQAARQQLHHNPQAVADGVIFVSLAEVDDVRDIPELLAYILGLAPLQGDGNITERLQRYLHKRQLLLFLDEAEYLVGNELSTLLDNLLRGAADFTVLATSRARLDVRGEHVFWVEGLTVGATDASSTRPDLERLLETSSAVALFLQTARRTRPEFTLTGENARKVLKVCRLVEGMPLGIELAAAWMGLLTLDELLEELSRSPDILTTEAGNVPPGQRSLRAVFDTSWKLLQGPEQRALRSLSIFRGGFSREAAQEACDVSLPVLSTLVNKCWLTRDENNRFSMHGLLQQYATEALAAEPEQYAESRARHSDYFCRWLAGKGETILGPRPQATLEAVQDELDNVRTACRVAVETGRVEPLRLALHALGHFYRSQGRYRAGERMFASLLPEDGDSGTAAHDVNRINLRILVWQAELRSLAGYYHAREVLLPEMLALVDQLEQAGHDMRIERMFIARQRGYRQLLQEHNPQAALDYFVEVHEHARKVGSWRELAGSLMGLARARRNLGRLEQAEQAVAEAIALFREAEDVPALAEAIILRCNVLARLGYLDKAVALLREAPELAAPKPHVEGYRLVNLAWVHLVLGQFDRAEQLARKGIESFQENEIWSITMAWVAILGELRLHKGYYAAAETTVAEVIPVVPPDKKPEAKAIERSLSGARALAEDQWTVAGDQLRRSLPAYRVSSDWNSIGVNACLALAARRGGEGHKMGQNHLMEQLRTTRGTALPPMLLCLAVAALLLADRGDVARAAEIYFRVWQEPFAQNSVWLRDVAGRELEGITSRLTEEDRSTARERAEGLDLWTTAEALLEELA